jgi:hypothetical protein
MLGKFGFVAIATVLAMCVMGRVESLAAHRGFAGSMVWAQEWDDADADSGSPTLPNVAGTYNGNVVDHKMGPGTITATIAQGGPSGGVLTGSWATSFGPVNEGLKGKVKPNSPFKRQLKIGGHCGLIAHGTFENGNEIVGVYHTTGCNHPDNGTFDMTD